TYQRSIIATSDTSEFTYSAWLKARQPDSIRSTIFKAALTANNAQNQFAVCVIDPIPGKQRFLLETLTAVTAQVEMPTEVVIISTRKSLDDRCRQLLKRLPDECSVKYVTATKYTEWPIILNGLLPSLTAQYVLTLLAGDVLAPHGLLQLGRRAMELPAVAAW